MGRNEGVTTGSHVMFYGFTDVADIIESWDHVEQPVGYGVVVGMPDDETCWVRMEQHNVVAVQKFHYVKIIDEPPPPASLTDRIGLKLREYLSGL